MSSNQNHLKKSILVSALLIELSGAQAATITVDNQGCTLADAIEAANTDAMVASCAAGSGADEINILADSTITLNSALPIINSEITLNCQGSTITRNIYSTGFTLLETEGANLTINDCTMTRGGSEYIDRRGFGGSLAAGGLYAFYSEININRSIFADNDSGAINLYSTNGSISDTLITDNSSETIDISLAGGGGGNAAGLTINGGNVNIDKTTISNNIATGNSEAGGVFITNNYFYSSDVVMTNSTISGNSSENRGGGINISSYYSYFNGTFTSVTLDLVTVANNSAQGNGGGIFNDNADLNLNGTLISGNTGNLGPELFASNVYSTNINAYNLFGLDGDSGTFGVIFSQSTSDGIIQQTSLDEVLDLNLTNNGGLTPTHALVQGSPAIDFIPPSECNESEDQTGENRPIQGSQGALGCDVGAFEYRDLIFRNGFD